MGGNKRNQKFPQNFFLTRAKNIMTKKHFKAAAKRVREINTFKHDYVSGHPNPNQIAEFLANWFEEENPNFNREKFLTSCKIA